MTNIRDRIRELRRIRAAELLPHPRNWRTHPSGQRAALRAVLEEIGYADALLARELPDGRLMLIDGHLRAETTPETIVPVLVLDVNEAEGETLLATIDPLSALAGANSEKLAQLLENVKTSQPALREMLAELARPPDSGSLGEDAESLRHQYNILITCESESDQVQLLRRLTDEGFQCRAFVV